MYKYKEEKSFESRMEEARLVSVKYPHRVPVIVERRPGSVLFDLPNKKFLVEKDSTMGQFVYTIRKRLPATTSSEAIFFYVGKTNVRLSARMIDVYEEYRDKDNFLYISFSEENVFGSTRSSPTSD